MKIKKNENVKLELAWEGIEEPYIAYANILLMVFNLVPIPPLDGSRIISGLLFWS